MLIGVRAGKGQAGVVERPTPHANGEFVVVKIHVAPLCTEFRNFDNERPEDCLGHEAAGEVVEVAQPGRVKVGDRVVVMPQYPCGKCPLCLAGNYIHCTNNHDVEKSTGNTCATGTYAQFIVKQDWLLVPIPDGMSYEYASMACCGLGPTFGAMELMGVGPLDTVLITGLGPVGLGGVINARFRGARVIGVESHSYRAELAKKLGAEAVVDPRDENAAQKILELTGGLGVDRAVETSGTAASKPLLLSAMRRKGKCAFVGWNGQLDVNTIIARGLTVYGAWHYNLADAPKVMQMISRVGPAIDMLITHRFGMTELQQAWELQRTGRCGKVLMYPWK